MPLTQTYQKPPFTRMEHLKTYAVGIIGGIMSKILLFMGDGSFLHWIIGQGGIVLAGALGGLGQYFIRNMIKFFKAIFNKKSKNE